MTKQVDEKTDGQKIDRHINSDQSSKGPSEKKPPFVEPKLTKQGDATKITAGFFGTFSP